MSTHELPGRSALAPSFPESTYYARHLRLPGFSEATQQRLRGARVLVVGVGGLGCPAAIYLAGAGVGRLTLCDADTVSASNLHRQVLFDAASVGRKKVDVAAARLRAMNPFIEVDTVDAFADAEQLAGLIPGHDLVLDGTDNFSAKFAINDACQAAGVPLVYGSIFQYEGQVSVFHLRGADGSPGYSYRDLYPQAPPQQLAQNCGEAGVVGVLPGVIGTLQATEAVKLLAGLGQPLSGELLTYDALSATTRKLALTRRAEVTAGAPNVAVLPVTEERDEISAAELMQRQRSGRAPVLVDVREAYERESGHLGGLHIPMAHLPWRLDELPREGEVVVYCRSGMRSARAVLYLRSVLSGVTVFNLAGGVDAASGAGYSCAA